MGVGRQGKGLRKVERTGGAQVGVGGGEQGGGRHSNLGTLCNNMEERPGQPAPGK